MRKKKPDDNAPRPSLTEIQLRLRECIKNAPITQQEIARQAGISKQTVSKYMTQNVFPALDTLAALCKILDVKSDYILGIDEEY